MRLLRKAVCLRHAKKCGQSRYGGHHRPLLLHAWYAVLGENHLNTVKLHTLTPNEKLFPNWVGGIIAGRGDAVKFLYALFCLFNIAFIKSTLCVSVLFIKGRFLV